MTLHYHVNVKGRRLWRNERSREDQNGRTVVIDFEVSYEVDYGEFAGQTVNTCP